MATDERERDREVTWDLQEHIGVISQDPKGWTRELNRVAWNGAPAKYDIRSWDEHHAKMSRGITLTRDEMAVIRGLLSDLPLDPEAIS